MKYWPWLIIWASCVAILMVIASAQYAAGNMWTSGWAAGVAFALLINAAVDIVIFFLRRLS